MPWQSRTHFCFEINKSFSAEHNYRKRDFAKKKKKKKNKKQKTKKKKQTKSLAHENIRETKIRCCFPKIHYHI